MIGQRPPRRRPHPRFPGKRQAVINEMALRRLRGENAQLVGPPEEVEAMEEEISRLVATVAGVLEPTMTPDDDPQIPDRNPEDDRQTREKEQKQGTQPRGGRLLPRDVSLRANTAVVSWDAAQGEFRAVTGGTL